MENGENMHYDTNDFTIDEWGNGEMPWHAFEKAINTVVKFLERKGTFTIQSCKSTSEIE